MQEEKDELLELIEEDEENTDDISEENTDIEEFETEIEEETKSEDELDYSDYEVPESYKFIEHGYLDYAKEVILERALPAIDGFKPSMRRILYAMGHLDKVKDIVKSASVVGTVMKIHPHGDGSIYETMVRLVGSGLYINTPYLKGKGDFGKVYSSDMRAAASRYTGVSFEKLSEELFKGMNGVDMIPSYNEELQEPLLLPVSYPNILCNPTQGVAVGMASNIVPLNFHEVIDATVEYIETGNITKLLAPDFTTAGLYVNNPEELRSLMHNGKAKLKLRGKWRIDGKFIIIDEIPYYTTVEEIKESVKDLPNVADVKDECDKRGLRLAIECSTRKVVDEVLQDVLRVSNLQMQVSSNLVFILNHKPVELGVYGVIEEWVKFRENVVRRELEKELSDLIYQIRQYDILVDLMTTQEKRDTFMGILLKETRKEAKDYLDELYPNTEEAIFDWILDKSIGSLAGIGNKQKSHLEQLRIQKGEVEGKLENVLLVISNELKEINKRYKFPRQTEITDEDITFDKSQTKRKPEAVPTVVQLNGMFLKKLKGTPTNQALPGAIKCMSDSIVSILDSDGRLLRVYLENVDMYKESDKGLYLPLYLEIEKEFKIKHYTIVENRKEAFIYKDGYAAVVDYNEWLESKRRLKVTPDGVAPAYMKDMIGIIDLSKPNILLFTKNGKLGIIKNTFLQKRRTARTKLLNVGKGDSIVKVAAFSDSELSSVLQEVDRFRDCFRVLTKKDGFDKEKFESKVNKVKNK